MDIEIFTSGSTMLWSNVILSIFLFLMAALALVLQFKLRRYRDIAKKIDPLLVQGIILVNHKGRIKACSTKAAHLLGFSAQEMISKNFFSLQSEHKEGLLEECRLLLLRASESLIPLRETFFYADEGISLTIDLVAMQLYSKQRVLLLKDKNKESRQVSLGKDFIANASHELRTPITIIKGFVETLKELPEISDAMLEDIFEKILRSCNRMDDIVKNLLILTDLDYLFDIHRQEVDLVALLDDCRHQLLEIHPAAQVTIHAASKEIQMQGDPSFLELALMNLLQNAVKYSAAPAQIEIEIDRLPTETLVSIADRGVGIPKESVPHIFDRFYSVNKTMSRRLGGAGLGLSIVKKILDKHDATISIEANPLGGTIFTIAFPHRVS